MYAKTWSVVVKLGHHYKDLKGREVGLAQILKATR